MVVINIDFKNTFLMAKYLFLLFVLFHSLYGNTQTFEWVKTPGITSTLNPVNLGYSTVADPFGDVYFAGYKDNPVLHGHVFGHVFYNKYTQNGELLFSKTFVGVAILNQMVTDSEGNILLAVEHLGSLEFEGLTIPASSPFPQHVFLKMSPDGHILWHRILFIPDLDVSSFQSIAVDKFNNIYLGYDNYGDCYIQKLSPTGEEISQIVQSNVNRITGLSVDPDGNIYTAGSCANINSTYAGVPQPTELSYTIYLAKYNSDGVFQWIKYVEDITCPEPKVKAFNANEIYFSSSLFIGVQLDDLIVDGPSTGGTDFFIAKLDGSGNYLWAREVPGNGSVEPGSRDNLTIDKQGNVYMCGVISGGMTEWGNGIVTNTNTFNNYEALVLKYNADGLIQLAVTAGGNLNDNASSISVDAEGAIYTSGMVRGDASFGNVSILQDNEFHYTPFLTKITATILSTKHPATSSVHIYPNPASDLVYIDIPDKPIRLSMYSINGQQIQFKMQDNQLDLSAIVSGVYVLLIETTHDVQRVKLIKK